MVTDTPRTNAQAWDIVESEKDWLLANPCTLHGVSLHFKHALKGDSTATPPVQPIPIVNEVNEKAQLLERFFSNKSYPKALLKTETKTRFGGRGLRVRKFSETRMGNMYRVWHRLQRLKSSLKTVIELDAYKSVVKEDGNSQEAIANRQIRNITEDTDFWQKIDALVDVMGPAYKLLRMVDGVRPTAGKFYYYAQQLQNHYNDRVEQYKWVEQLRDAWTADWDYIHCAFHSAGFACDPEFAGLDKPPEVELEFLEVAERMLKAAPAELKLSADDLSLELTKFNNKTGIFAKNIVWKQATKLAGHVWWQRYGASCPTLRWLAMRILPQTTSAAAAESAWSEYDYVFNRRRNCLGKERASKLVFVHCNARLIRKYESRNYLEKFIPFEEESADGSDDPMDD